MSDDNITKVQSSIDSLNLAVETSLKLYEKINEFSMNNGKKLTVFELELFADISTLDKAAKKFLSQHAIILDLKDSLSSTVLKNYYQSISVILTRNWYLVVSLNGCCNQVFNSSSIESDTIEYLKWITTKAITTVNELIEETSKTINSYDPMNPTVFIENIFGMDEKSDYASIFQQYLDIATDTDFIDPLFKCLNENILKLTDNVYNANIDPEIPPILSYASIVGPSFMGKTQFAFSLARLCPLFYVNFLLAKDTQSVYKAFFSVSDAFRKCLRDDIGELEDKIKSLDSDDIRAEASAIKLRTIGFLWELVKDSIEFKGFAEGNGTGSDSDWFKYYIRKRTIKYEVMTFKDYHLKLSKKSTSMKFALIFYFVEDLLSQPEIKLKGFKPPIVFIDEMISINDKNIKLLRNISRIIGLRCVLASTNAKVNNLLNLATTIGPGTGTGPEFGSVWVHAIRELPKANVKAILKLLGWNKYATDLKNFDTEQLLADIGIALDTTGTNRIQLHNLITLMIEDSKTCLQGVCIFVFMALKEKLLEFKENGQLLNTRTVFEYILEELRSKIKYRKMGAFSEKGHGRYLSLAMMSNYRVFEENVRRKTTCNLAPTSEIILRAINQHFYFFGRPKDPSVIPFNYAGEKLMFKGYAYKLCSHFKLFRENIFFCMALWIGVYLDPISDKDLIEGAKKENSTVEENMIESGDYEEIDEDKDKDYEPSVASIVSENIYETNYLTGNPVALKNDSATQECMVHWALCYATMKNVSELNPGASFLERFINLIQLNETSTISNNEFTSRPNTNVIGLRNRFKLNTCPELVTFMSQIKIPYLLSPHNITNNIKSKLQGLCHFGTCARQTDQRGVDIEFDLLYCGALRQGYCECKYVDVNLDKKTVLEYIIKTKGKNSPFSMIVSFSLQERLKCADLWACEDYTEEDEINIESISGKMARLEIDVNQDEMKAEEKRRIREENRKLRIRSEREKEAKISGISIYSIFHEEYDLKIVPLVKMENPTAVFLIIQTNFFIPKK